MKKKTLFYISGYHFYTHKPKWNAEEACLYIKTKGRILKTKTHMVSLSVGSPTSLPAEHH